MRRFVQTLVLLAPLALAAPLATADGLPSPKEQQQRLTNLFKQSDRLLGAGDPVHAYLALREAVRLEQLWSNNTAGPETEGTARLGRLTTGLLRREDGSLLRVLHSRQVPAGDKLALLRALEEDVLAQQAALEE